MSRDAIESLQHFEAVNSQTTQLKKMLRKCCCPDAMRMENSPSTTSRRCRAMQQRLCAALGLDGRRHLALFVDNHKIVGAKMPFVLAARCDQQLQRIAIDNDAVIAGRAERPAPIPKLMSNPS